MPCLREYSYLEGNSLSKLQKENPLYKPNSTSSDGDPRPSQKGHMVPMPGTSPLASPGMLRIRAIGTLCYKIFIIQVHLNSDEIIDLANYQLIMFIRVRRKSGFLNSL